MYPACQAWCLEGPTEVERVDVGEAVAHDLVVDPRDAPVEHVHLAKVAEHDVRGLEITVDHAAV